MGASSSGSGFEGSLGNGPGFAIGTGRSDVPRYVAGRALLLRQAHEFVNKIASAQGVTAEAGSSRGARSGASHHDAQPLCRPRNAGIEPPGAAVLECKALVEQHHVVPLRALRFVHREHVAVIELVIGLALLPGDGFDGAAKT